MSAFDESRDQSGLWGQSPLAPSFIQARSVKRAILSEQAEAWTAGRPARPEDLLARWPTDPDADSDAASVLAGDYFARRDRGENPSIADYEARFPEHGRSLAGLVSHQNLLRSIGAASKPSQGRALRLPEVGDELYGFRLRSPLGRGAFACVYIAEQGDLAGRPVVLKISAIEGTEPQTLAQLQHTNIVPIYSVHEDPRAGLRAVCMPYFGGAALSSILTRLWSELTIPAQGSQFVKALEAVQAPPPETLSTRLRGAPAEGASPPQPDGHDGAQTPLVLIGGLGYLQTAAWVVARLAEGLQHAHQRGIFHRDVKPSNILISSDGEPLLLDFNLAHETDGDPAQATLGGTVAYMAPEHLRAIIGRNAAQLRDVDHRSDIYSLGMVLAEMLTGHSPFDQSGSYSVLPLQIEAIAVERSKAAPSLKAERPEIPWSLESIVRKAMDPDPARRYQRADHLAEDLRRFLDDRPLKYAPELSRVEQARKFLRRHPRLLSTGAVTAAALAGLLAVGAVLSGVRGHLAETRAHLGVAQSRERKQAHDAGMTRALCLVNTTSDLEDHLRKGVAVCEEVLALYATPADPSGESHPDWARLAAGERRQVAEDRRELLLLLAGARVRLATEKAPAARDALALLDRAEAIGGLAPSRALWLDRATYRDQLGDGAGAAEARRRAAGIEAASARDHYLLATAHAREGGRAGLGRAVAALDEALRRNPRHYWSLVQRGICRLELGEFVLAAGDFGACTGLWPEFAWGYFNRGYVLDRAGRKAEAIDDYTAALKRDPEFVPAYVNRGLARLELARPAEALADFDRALALGRDDAALHAGRGMALEALGKHPEADGAFAASFARAAPRPDPARARLCWTYGFAVAARLPERARDAFDDVLLQDPKQPQALYGRAMLAMARDDAAESQAYFDRAVAAAPTFVEARRGRAVLEARRGAWEPARRDVNWCLERQPESGDTLYAAACVAARAAGAFPGPQASRQALDLLERAVDRGAGRRAAADPDLAALRRLPRFQTLVARASRTPGGDRP